MIQLFVPSRFQLTPRTRIPRPTFVKIHKYDTDTPEEFLKWWMTLTEQIKANGYGGKYDMLMNLAQAMLHGRGLDAFVNERRTKCAKNKIRVVNNQTELNVQHIYDYTIFELAIRDFDIQSGWRDAFDCQRKYTRRDFFMGKLNPEKFSQRLEEMNKYLDYFPILGAIRHRSHCHSMHQVKGFYSVS
jgi:hypothetical protein